MANYLKQPGCLIVWPVLKEVAESDLFLCSIGVRARYDMSGEELLNACLDAWQAPKDRKYRLRLIRAEGERELSADSKITVAESGIRNGDALQIVTE